MASPPPDLHQSRIEISSQGDSSTFPRAQKPEVELVENPARTSTAPHARRFPSHPLVGCMSLRSDTLALSASSSHHHRRAPTVALYTSAVNAARHQVLLHAPLANFSLPDAAA